MKCSRSSVIVQGHCGGTNGTPSLSLYKTMHAALTFVHLREVVQSKESDPVKQVWFRRKLLKKLQECIRRWTVCLVTVLNRRILCTVTS